MGRGFENFVQHCGATNRLLQQRIHDRFQGAQRRWGRITMTVGGIRGQEVRITNRSYVRELHRPTEELFEISDRLVNALQNHHIHINNQRRVSIPDVPEPNNGFVDRVMQALGQILQDPA